MIDPATFGLFLLGSLLLLVSPGPAVLFLVARSLEGGRRLGLVSTLGVAVGSLVHVAAAAFGVSALLATSATAYSAMKWLGALYLLGLGIATLRGEDPAPLPFGSRTGLRPARAFAQGVVVNVLNPKTALFFLAFLPQFVDVSAGAVEAQVLMLGSSFVLLGLVSDAAWVMVASALSRWLREHPAFPRWRRRVSGGVYLGLGMATGLAGRER